VPITSDDELGRLGEGFNRMTAGLAEKEYLGRFLSGVARSRLRAGATLEEQAVRTRATVMFSDIRGFTTLAERHPPEAIVEMLNRYFTGMTRAIEAEGGFVEKFIGDAIMAVFLPALGRTHPAERAARAALAMRRELADFNTAREAAGQFPIRTGIGLATGEVLLGMLGRADGRRRDFTVTGPTVNAAAAMEKRSKEARTTGLVLCPETAGFVAGLGTAHPLPAHDDLPPALEFMPYPR